MKHHLKKAIEIIARRLHVWEFLYFMAGIFMRKKLLAVFTYHRVTGKDGSEKYFLGYDRGLDSGIFELQIKAIKKYFTIIDLDEFLDIIQGKSTPASHSALLTFDDTDADFVEHAHPVLRRHNCPCVNFAPTGCIDTDNRFWHLRISNIFFNLDAESWKSLRDRIGGLPDRLRSIIEESSVDSRDEKTISCRRVLIFLKNMDIAEREHLVDEFEKAAGFDYTLGIDCMTWRELARMEENGVKIESHTDMHPELARVDRERIKSELDISMKALEKNLNKKVRTLCYPAGSFDDRVLEVMAESDYEAGFASQHFTCRYPLDGYDPYRIPRFGMHGENEDDIHGYLGKIIVKRILKGH